MRQAGCLDSAHVHGKGRRRIIESVLKQHMVDDTVYVCDLLQAEKDILEARLPITETFKFICKACHTEYDSGANVQEKDVVVNDNSNRSAKADGDFTKLHRIKAWADKRDQINFKIIQAYRSILQRKGSVHIEDLKAECTLGTSKYYIGDKTRFSGHLASMKTDSGNSHGKVFYTEGSYVKLYEVVERIIESSFPVV